MPITEKPFVLFADDDQNTLELLAFYAKAYNWEAEFVSNAREIVERVNYNCGERHRCYDIICADVNYFNTETNTPRLTGITAALEVRKSFPNIPIVFITAFGNTLIRQEIKKIGGEIIIKPFDFDILFERLEFLIKWNRESRIKRVSQGLEDAEAGERRRASINRTTFQRRNTDRPIAIPSALIEAIREVREHQKETRVNNE